MKADTATVAITGADGFIGGNLAVRLRELGHTVLPVTRGMPEPEACEALAASAIVFHLAGVNSASDPAEFFRGNHDYSTRVADAIRAAASKPLVVVSSSIKAVEDTDYGRSKLAGERALLELGDSVAVSVWRLPNVFGKWARPNYNSAVATFCHNIARGLPVRIDDPAAPLSLLHVDDLIDQWVALMASPSPATGLVEPDKVHTTTVGEAADTIRAFADRRGEGEVGAVGVGLERALYTTFISYLPEPAFSYPLVAHTDPRGSFVEMLKTSASGQISYFNSPPGVTRGGHYHHAKVEKFLVVHGRARFRFRHILSGTTHEIVTSAAHPVVVETVPGWAHDVTNIGEDELVAVVWANEVFNRGRPDTFAMPL
ncbi:NAD-dependent epimerase/dehydratase family protein [Sphingomonas sp.]|jgi:UDP-2-acetamido-2,6-beta-L-arabino-hexul-4-ose reductase|uniref:polysaccharide biosynthesis C-terminal domain-containing protein n=1 Tax=Sphingomonas sp. TaxID=28214 RepID=UPI002E36814E|nr:NAD-dependent epimerase/dehydratase family protein [Sphingomonas sp.]HEX4695449.1 NAD-dependent epimerase/dehydratase family protein [Sphingomonas sp.]